MGKLAGWCHYTSVPVTCPSDTLSGCNAPSLRAAALRLALPNQERDGLVARTPACWPANPPLKPAMQVFVRVQQKPGDGALGQLPESQLEKRLGPHRKAELREARPACSHPHLTATTMRPPTPVVCAPKRGCRRQDGWLGCLFAGRPPVASAAAREWESDHRAQEPGSPQASRQAVAAVTRHGGAH